MAKREQEQGYELKTEVVTINRTSLVKRGGRTFSFTAVVVVGDGKSKIGLGIGKAKEVSLAVQKAVGEAKKNMVNIHLKKGTIHHPIRSKYGASVVYMAPASIGTGVIAGGAMRAVFDCLGIKNILAKRYRSSNPINVAKATIKGLMEMESISVVARRRAVSKSVVVGQEVIESEKGK
ncbi:30S ribosomal protein S5 [Candidatus Synchoanobacter obligatus]|uniref:Small ribosomal subunit protein uS5 n=1 Tax=Candidatus Synchoanobacter obligatus TaxID=2919597 RepID=A0ABT1L6L4_9GAMM|nr:30S ribosomal protein S5 [Candidatus Synchoanobacter obligatus]MCP8352503.1 30S ribosomal protein S5 [Candidatus Synchoanobacter obligatus]